jgi:hypothetical protein
MGEISSFDWIIEIAAAYTGEPCARQGRGLSADVAATDFR